MIIKINTSEEHREKTIDFYAHDYQDMSECPFCQSRLPISIEKAYPEAYRLARRFHEFYEQSAPFFGYQTRKETKEFDPESSNGRLMAWVCYEIIKEEKQRLFELMKDHYWDSVTDVKDIILKHLESILEIE